jgi:predicted dehydrogenase
VSGATLLGILGCGPTAEQHWVPAITRLASARLTAAYDPDSQRRRLIARAAPGCRSFDSAEALFEARVVDAVLVGSGPESRATLAVKALGAGLPVLIEPPFAASLEEAEWIREAERIVRLPLMLGYHRRWLRPVERVRKALAGGTGGELAVESLRLVAGDAGEALELLDPHLDLVRYLVDREIAAVSGRYDPPHQIEARLVFHGGGVALCRAGPGTDPRDRITVRAGVRAGVRAYQLRPGSARSWPAAGLPRLALDLAGTALRRASRAPDPAARSHRAMLAGFVQSVQSRVGTPPGTTDGLAALLATDAIRRSVAEAGAEVPVPPTPSA